VYPPTAPLPAALVADAVALLAAEDAALLAREDTDEARLLAALVAVVQGRGSCSGGAAHNTGLCRSSTGLNAADAALRYCLGRSR